MKFSTMALVASLGISGSVWADGAETNPPPAIKLSEFGKYDLRPLIQPQLKEGAAQRAADTLRQHLENIVLPVVQGFSPAAAPRAEHTLIIQPVLVEMHFVGGKARFWAGALAGNSFVTLRVKLTDSASGEVIGEPEFFQRANAMGGAWTVGKTDKDMLQRVVTLVSNYLTTNHEEAIGGPTGRD
jgi:hypothetical protein